MRKIESKQLSLFLLDSAWIKSQFFPSAQWNINSIKIEREEWVCSPKWFYSVWTNIKAKTCYVLLSEKMQSISFWRLRRRCFMGRDISKQYLGQGSCYNVSNLHHGGSETGLGSRIKYIEAGFSQFGLFVRHTHTSHRDSDIVRLLKRFGIAIISFFTSSTSDISKIFPSWDFMMIYLDYRLIWP